MTYETKVGLKWLRRFKSSNVLSAEEVDSVPDFIFRKYFSYVRFGRRTQEIYHREFHKLCDNLQHDISKVSPNFPSKVFPAISDYPDVKLFLLYISISAVLIFYLVFLVVLLQYLKIQFCKSSLNSFITSSIECQFFSSRKIFIASK